MPHPQNMTSAEDEALILDSIDQFLERDVRTVAHDLEAADEYPQEIFEKLCDLGMMGATISPEYGGLGLSAATYAKIVERVSAVWMSVSGLFNAHLIMAQTVERAGTEAQKQQWLPRFATGELFGGIALTEPDCGTDLQGIRTKATLDGDEYVIDGNKMWITNSVQGNILAVLVKTDPNTDPPHKGMSLLLAERSSGYDAKKLEKLGYKGIDTGELRFDGVRDLRYQRGVRQHSGLERPGSEIRDDHVDLGAHVLQRHGVDSVHAEGVLGRDRRNRARSVHTESMERLEVRLDAGATPAVTARNRESHGLIGLTRLIDGHVRVLLSGVGRPSHRKRLWYTWV